MINKKTKILVIGYGNFGSLLVKLFKKYFNEVYVLSKNLSKQDIKDKKIKVIEGKELAKIGEMDVVVPSVPISKYQSVVKKVNKYLKEGSLLIDVCSVKVYPKKVMKKEIKENVKLINSHPMWGPESYKANKGIKGLKIVLHPLRIDKKEFNEIKNKLEKAGFKIIIQTPEDHDKDAAKSQALAQYVGKVLEQMPLSEVEIATLGYERLRSLMPFVVTNTYELFLSIQNYNPYAQQVRDKFLKTALKVEERIRREKGEGDFV